MTSTAQSKAFKLGQWAEIQNSIIKELNRSYVDTLPIERMKKASIDKMLSILDPYTIYVPEESNEDFQLMIILNFRAAKIVFFSVISIFYGIKFVFFQKSFVFLPYQT